MFKELKLAIIEWLVENENVWNRTNLCVEKFRPYKYHSEGEYLIGGKIVYNFIIKAEDLLFERNERL